MTTSAFTAIPEVLPNPGSPETRPDTSDQEKLATVTQLHPYGIPTLPIYAYAPVESADLQIRDNLRHELGASALALQSHRPKTHQACDENLAYYETKREHSVDESEHYAELAKGAEQTFWEMYAGAILARQATAED